MMTSSTGLSAVPSVSLPQLTNGAGSRSMMVGTDRGQRGRRRGQEPGGEIGDRETRQAANDTGQPGQADRLAALHSLHLAHADETTAWIRAGKLCQRP